MKTAIKIFLSFIFGISLYTNAFALGNGTFRGPFQIRNQFPVNQQFLSFSADHAYLLDKGRFRISAIFSHANTFARSPGILTTIGTSTNRIAFDQATAGKSLSSKKDLFYIDTGSGHLTVDLAYGISDYTNMGITIPVINYYGGFLDTPIETFHKYVGYPYASRSMMASNKSVIFINNDQADLYSNPVSSGLGDLTIYIKQQINSESEILPAMAVRAAVKFPTGNVSSFHGSGSVDYGFDLIISKILSTHMLTSDLSMVIPGSWKLLPNLNIRNIYSWILAYEITVGNHFSLIVQNQITNGAITSNFHPDITRPVFEWTIGTKYDLYDNLRLSAAITENYINHENTSDFGFHVGIETSF